MTRYRCRRPPSPRTPLRAYEVALGWCPHRGEAGKHAHQQRRQDGGARCERQDHEVGLDARDRWQRVGGGQQRHAHEPWGGEDATQAAGARQDDAFRHDLRGQPPAPRAERRAHHQLVPARRGPRQQKIADVRAGDEQHQADRAEQRDQNRAAISHEVVGKAHDVGADAAILFRVLPGQARGHERRGGSRPFQAHVVAQPRDAHRAVAYPAPSEDGVVVLADRDVDVVQEAAPRPREAHRRGCHAHNRVSLAVEHECVPDDAGVGAEPAAPVVFADHGDACRPEPILVRTERAPENRRHREGLEEVGRDHLSGQRFRLTAARQCEAVRAPACQLFELADLASKVLEVGERERVLWRVNARPVHGHEAVGIRERQGTEDDAIDDAEYGRGRANAQRQRQHRGQGEPG